MRTKRVEEIVLPYREDVPMNPAVNAGDKIIDAIELMLTHDLQCIAVVRNNRPVGMVRLEDAFEKLGLQLSRPR